MLERLTANPVVYVAVGVASFVDRLQLVTHDTPGVTFHPKLADAALATYGAAVRFTRTKMIGHDVHNGSPEAREFGITDALYVLSRFTESNARRATPSVATQGFTT
jgi:hypothetical protein